MEQRFVGDVLVLTPTQNLNGGKEIEDLAVSASRVLAQENPRIVIDLGKIEWVNSPGLNALVKIHISCANREGWMRVARVSNRIKSLLVVTKVIMLFDTFDTVEEALAHADPVKAV